MAKAIQLNGNLSKFLISMFGLIVNFLKPLKLDEYKYCHIEELGDDKYGDFAFHFCKERRPESTPYSSKSEPYACAIRIACKYVAMCLSNRLGSKCIVPIEYTKNDNEVVVTTMWRMNNEIL